MRQNSRFRCTLASYKKHAKKCELCSKNKVHHYVHANTHSKPQHVLTWSRLPFTGLYHLEVDFLSWSRLPFTGLYHLAVQYYHKALEFPLYEARNGKEQAKVWKIKSDKMSFLWDFEILFLIWYPLVTWGIDYNSSWKTFVNRFVQSVNKPFWVVPRLPSEDKASKAICLVSFAAGLVSEIRFPRNKAAEDTTRARNSHWF